MDKESGLESHFDAIKSIIAPYHGHLVVDALPSALLFLIQFSQVTKTDSPIRARILRELDSVTSMVGKIGDIVRPDEFEQIKQHYAELQLKISRSEKRDAEKEEQQ